MLIFFNDQAEKDQGGGGFLTEEERKQFLDSFQSDAEIKLYNKFLHIKRGLFNGLMITKQALFLYRETIASLNGYCVLSHEYAEFMQTLNIIYKATETPEQKKKLLDIIERRKRYLWVSIAPTKNPEKDGIMMQSTGRTNKEKYDTKIHELLTVLSERAFYQLGQTKTMVLAMRDHIKDYGFNVKVFKDAVKAIDNDLKEDKAALPKFSKKQPENGFLEFTSPKRLFPEYEKAEMDETLYKKMREGGLM